MIFMAATEKGRFIYHGSTYDLAPLSPPEINPYHILAAASGLERAILDEHPGRMTAVQFEAERLPGFPKPLPGHLEEVPSGSRILLLRAGGIGDLIMLTPAIHALEARLDGRATIHLATYADYAAIFTGLVQKIVPYPVTLARLLQDVDYYVEFSDTNDLFESGEMTDYYLDCLGIDPQTLSAADKKPRLPAAMTADPIIRERLSQVPGRFKIFYNGGASDKIRHLPGRVLAELAQAHPELGFVVPGEAGSDLPNVFAIDTSGGLAAYVAAIAGCDAIVSSDSSAYHIAAAFDIPALVFFGPIGSTMRTSYYPKVIALDAEYHGETCASPCGISTIRRRTRVKKPLGRNRVTLFEQGTAFQTLAGRRFEYDPQQGCPESCARGTDISPCLDSFTRKRILAGFSRLLDLIPA